MPNIKSAVKRVKVSEKKTLQNSMIKSATKTAIKKYEEANANKDPNTVELLNAAKKQKANGGTSQPAPRQTSTGQQMMESVMAASSDLDSLENLYFNPEEENVSLDEAYEVYPNGQKHKLYDKNITAKIIAMIISTTAHNITLNSSIT